ncbi:MAG: hypothetical protein KJ566_02890 [Nanoarchaeota archaeon]|nr:hypothetical protein [Nanoarchaeota archaeon]
MGNEGYLKEFESLYKKSSELKPSEKAQDFNAIFRRELTKFGKEKYKSGKARARATIRDNVKRSKPAELSKNYEDYGTCCHDLGYASALLSHATDSGNLVDASTAINFYQRLGKADNPEVQKKVLEAIKRRISLDKELSKEEKSYMENIKYFFKNPRGSGPINNEGRQVPYHLRELFSKTKSGIESKVTTAIASLACLGGLFLLSPNVTGNAVVGIQKTNSNWFGGILFLLGLVVFFIVAKPKKSSKKKK